MKCILTSLGFTNTEHEAVLNLNCDTICALQKSDVPLGVITAENNKAIAIQTTRGVVPIIESELPKDKPIIKEVRKELLSDIRNATHKLNPTEVSQIMQQMPSNKVVTIKALPNNNNNNHGLLAAIRRGKPLKKVSNEPPAVRDTHFFSEMMEQVRKNVNGENEEDNNDDDDDDDDDDWD